jgi:hypothetical protein
VNEEYEARVRQTAEPSQPVKGFGPLTIDVVRITNGAVVGSYVRNYSTLFRTFASFRKDGQSFALYSPLWLAPNVLDRPILYSELGGPEGVRVQ